MSLRIKKINNIQVVKIPQIGKGDIRPVKGQDLFDLYSNIFICSHRKSGKTTTIYNIIVHCCTKNTILILFVGTINADKDWGTILKYCDKKGIPYIIHTGLYDDQFKDIDKLHEIVNFLMKKNKKLDDAVSNDTRELPDTNKSQMDLFNDSVSNDTRDLPDESDHESEQDLELEPIKNKSKWQVPEYFFIFDDISSQIKNSASLETLLKEGRHIHSKVIISSQSWVDVPKGGRENIDNLLLFKDVSEERLDEMRKECSIKLGFEKFLAIYNYAIIPTDEKPKPFLYWDKNTNTFRKCFDELISYEDIE